MAHENFMLRVARADCVLANSLRSDVLIATPGVRQAKNGANYASVGGAEAFVRYDAEFDAARISLPPRFSNIDPLWFAFPAAVRTAPGLCAVAEITFSETWSWENLHALNPTTGLPVWQELHKFLHVRRTDPSNKLWYEPNTAYTQTDPRIRISRIRYYDWDLGPGAFKSGFTVDASGTNYRKGTAPAGLISPVSYDSDALGPVTGNVYVERMQRVRYLIVADRRTDGWTYLTTAVKVDDQAPIIIQNAVPVGLPVGTVQHFEVEGNTSSNRHPLTWAHFFAKNITLHAGVDNPMSLLDETAPPIVVVPVPPDTPMPPPSDPGPIGPGPDPLPIPSPQEPVMPEVSRNSSFSIVAQHDGVDTLGYRFRVGDTVVGDMPVSMRAADGTISYACASGAFPRGGYTASVVAYNADGESTPATASFVVLGAPPAPPTSVTFIQ
jgi:hypothetical protein